MAISKEKQEIINTKGNILITANPGTGKTFLLAHKYLALLKEKIKPEEILCLTFTNKAKCEMEDRILEFIKEKNIQIDTSKLNVYTFHAYALENLEGYDVISSNLLRYTIYKYIKDYEVLNYGEEYLINTIVPKMENIIRYLKSFGITPDKIDFEEVKKHLKERKIYQEGELEIFTQQFIEIFKEYEKTKKQGECDYADLLIEFLKLKEIPHFKYVLVDELQDVNDMEAEIALKSGEKFIAVGDPKQAIFGFQGGSILNFKKFKNSKEKILSENYRSTNEILKYASEYFIKKTKQKEYQKALENFENKKVAKGEKPSIYSVMQENIMPSTCILAKELIEKGEQVAIIARTNFQIMNIAKELSARGIEHSSTFFAASNEAKDNIISFLRAIFSKDMGVIKNAMFTPFFPINLQDAFELASKRELSIKEVYEKCPEFKKLKECTENVEDLNILFREKIIPVAMSYGGEYLLAAMTLQQACGQALKLLNDKSLSEVISYLKSCDMLSNKSDVEKGVVVTTVHKAKGKQFDNVIYIPKKPKNDENFQNHAVEGILASKGRNVDEELEEDTLRIDFVAFTRAKRNLIVITDMASGYLNPLSELKKIQADAVGKTTTTEIQKKAYSLFINKEYDKAKELLESKDEWMKEFVKTHFDGLDRVSFSKLTQNAYEYFKNNILSLWIDSPAMDLGSIVHDSAEEILKGNKVKVEKSAEKYVENTKKLIKEIKKKYPQTAFIEKSLKIPVSKLIETKDRIMFKGILDAVFKNKDGEYLLVDWKTSANNQSGSIYRQQLSVYKKILSESEGIPLDKIKVAIGYVGLRRRINDGKIDYELKDLQPAKSAYATVMKRISLFLEWKNNPDKFFEDLKHSKEDETIKRIIIEQYEKGKFK